MAALIEEIIGAQTFRERRSAAAEKRIIPTMEIPGSKETANETQSILKLSHVAWASATLLAPVFFLSAMHLGTKLERRHSRV